MSDAVAEHHRGYLCPVLGHRLSGLTRERALNRHRVQHDTRTDTSATRQMSRLDLIACRSATEARQGTRVKSESRAAAKRGVSGVRARCR